MRFPVGDERVKESPHKVKSRKVYLTVLLPSVHLLQYLEALILKTNIPKKKKRLKKMKFREERRGRKQIIFWALPNICTRIASARRLRFLSRLPWMLLQWRENAL